MACLFDLSILSAISSECQNVCPFSLDRILKITATGQVVYKAEHDSCRNFPEPASCDLKAGVSRNFHTASNDL